MGKLIDTIDAISEFGAHCSQLPVINLVATVVVTTLTFPVMAIAKIILGKDFTKIVDHAMQRAKDRQAVLDAKFGSDIPTIDKMITAQDLSHLYELALNGDERFNLDSLPKLYDPNGREITFKKDRDGHMYAQVAQAVNKDGTVLVGSCDPKDLHVYIDVKQTIDHFRDEKHPDLKKDKHPQWKNWKKANPTKAKAIERSMKKFYPKEGALDSEYNTMYKFLLMAKSADSIYRNLYPERRIEQQEIDKNAEKNSGEKVQNANEEINSPEQTGSVMDEPTLMDDGEHNHIEIPEDVRDLIESVNTSENPENQAERVTIALKNSTTQLSFEWSPSLNGWLFEMECANRPEVLPDIDQTQPLCTQKEVAEIISQAARGLTREKEQVFDDLEMASAENPELASQVQDILSDSVEDPEQGITQADLDRLKERMSGLSENKEITGPKYEEPSLPREEYLLGGYPGELDALYDDDSDLGKKEVVAKLLSDIIDRKTPPDLETLGNKIDALDRVYDTNFSRESDVPHIEAVFDNICREEEEEHGEFSAEDRAYLNACRDYIMLSAAVSNCMICEDKMPTFANFADRTDFSAEDIRIESQDGTQDIGISPSQKLTHDNVPAKGENGEEPGKRSNAITNDDPELG